MKKAPRRKQRKTQRYKKLENNTIIIYKKAVSQLVFK